MAVLNQGVAPQRPKILVMDDSETVLEVTQEVLEDGGYDVVTLSSSAMLPSIWNAERPDLALIDVSMPVMDGQSVVELMRRSNLHRCPLVLYSDQPEPRLKELTRTCGASGYIRKTHDGRALLREVGSYLSPGAAALPAPVKGERLVVFVVDDDKLSRAATEQVVRAAGAEAVGLENGEQCLAALEKQRPALILMDLVMNPLGGEACCRAVRENRAWADVPVVMISAAGSTMQVMQAWRAGADDFLPKPISTPALGHKLEALRSMPHQGSVPSPETQKPVLLADHSAFFRNRLGRMLESSGYRMLYAKSAEQALELARDNAGGLGGALLDLALPGARPLELLKGLKRQCGAPILVLTEADGTSPLVRELERAGAAIGDKKLPCEKIVHQLTTLLRREGGLRICERVPFFSWLEFCAGDGRWTSGFSYDLSVNGIFVTTLNPAPPGTALEMKVSFPGWGTAACNGQVAWANPIVPRTTYSYMVGMGVQFVTPDEPFSKLLDKYTASLRKNGGSA